LLEGREIADWPEAVYGEYAYCRCIRTKSGKFIHRTEGFPGELYDLANDPGERRNLVDDPNFAERERELKAQMDEWFGGLGCADYDMWKHAKQKVLPSVERVDRG
jgi:arylsulfatase A-like enzyme